MIICKGPAGLSHWHTIVDADVIGTFTTPEAAERLAQQARDEFSRLFRIRAQRANDQNPRINWDSRLYRRAYDAGEQDASRRDWFGASLDVKATPCECFGYLSGYEKTARWYKSSGRNNQTPEAQARLLHQYVRLPR